MSAIVGIYNFKKEPINNNCSMDLMKSSQCFPADNVHTLQQDNIFLGCHAQWITSESINEKLPYYDYNRQLAITADVILDNRKELFDMLQVNKQDRRSMPDSQLIVLAYQKWGEDVPKYLIGDFAIVIWDEKKEKLFAARDFSGSRTLYFYNDSKRFAFSTTIEPLFTLPYLKKELNEEWMAEFLAIPNIVESVDMVSTPYRSVHQLPPSHSLTVKEGKVTLQRYSKIEVNETLKLSSNEEYEEAFQEVFQRAVSDRLRTFGKVGSHLSGGLDSGSVVSFAAKNLQKENKQLHTYSYIPEGDFVDWTDKYYVPDERPFIKETVKHVGNINDNYLDFAGISPLTEIDNFLDIMEMPFKFFENTFWLKGISERAHKDGIKILLNGARGNHSISWGSLSLTYQYYSHLMKKLNWLRLNQELDAYCRNFRTGKKVMIPFVAKKTFPKIGQLFSKGAQSDYQFPVFINPSLAERTKVFEKLGDYGVNLNGGSSVGNLTDYRKKYYQNLYTWNKSGVANTKLSLRYSLWDRDPTNDLRVIQFCLSLPEEQYVNGGMERSFIRRATKGVLPDTVRLNQSRRGIQGADVIHRMTPKWGDFISQLHEMIKDPQVSYYLDGGILKNALQKLGNTPRPEMVFEDEFKILTRSLIVYRFLKRF
ncbi:asparagine synthase-related protein [Halalkalibacter alkaliphilus]|uniref:asparagine synthase (glutamine-hydrolyzing) n=1 Tax=Halalkalibacter alkaliphilus TaxID=2917993 RepID=A0A9X2A3D7_9BACI|nr:asparagine synthase-related protein [Halalkalibacter alkaliphilus]MCL7746087.1 asparagine synthase-related protein [Halalkalibacter alkaliphilus]